MPAAKSKRPAQTCAAGTPDPLHLDQQLCFALYAASNRIQRLYRPLLEPLGLTYPQYLVMLVLWQHGRRSVSELGAALHLDSGTLTPLLKRLEAAGWVQRQRCREDERRVYVEPTAEGRALRTHVAGLPQQVACATHLEPAALLRLRDDVRQLLASLGSD
jgi:DNA-binding MarR family transcriptional regulator